VPVNVWATATGEGHEDLSGWVNPNGLWFYIPNDTPKSQFIGTDQPRRVRFAGGFGVGSQSETLPTTGDMGVVLWWYWIQFEFEVAAFPSGFVGGNRTYWKLPPGLTVWYQLTT
jgi:hypothetical protein